MSTQQRSYDEEVAAWERESAIVDDPNSIYQQVPDFPHQAKKSSKSTTSVSSGRGTTLRNS